MLLLLVTKDLQLQEELLLLQQAGIRRIHRDLTGLLFLIWGNVLMILELFHSWFGLFVFLTTTLVTSSLRLTLL